MRDEQKVPDSVNCCGSCHSDDDEGYASLCSWSNDEVEYDVCCTLANWEPEPPTKGDET